MTKISKATKALGLILKKPVLLNKVLQDPDSWKEYLHNTYQKDQGLPVIQPTDLLNEEFNEKLEIFTFLDGGSMVTDIALLKALARGIKNCRYFEIGTWRGESAINMAEVCEEVFTLNLSDEELRKRGVSEGVINQQGLFSKKNQKIVHLRGDSAKYNFAAIAKKFDLIFIDGSHHYDDVKTDTLRVFQHLVHEKSVVVWHDYAVTPEEVRSEVLAGILDGLTKQKHEYLYHVANTKSAVFLPEKLEGEKLEKPFYPRHYYSVGIKYKSFEKE